MTGLRRTLGLCVALAAFQAPIWASAPVRGAVRTADELQDTFKQAVEMLQRGHKEDALKALQKVLAMSPDQKQAYELWTSTDYRDWQDLLTEGGDFELAARRLIDLAREQRNTLKNDKDAIEAAVKDATTSDDPVVRRRAIRTLSATHGEYAVPYILPFLAGGGDEDRRVLSMHALAQMSTDVVVPLIESLQSTNAVLRRNVALVLGLVGDARATGALQLLAASDSDEVVRKAAAEALARLPADRTQHSAVENFLAAGQDYYQHSDAALRFGQAGDVVWNWKDERLQAMPIPRGLYATEMSKRSYFMALRADPTSTQALAGLARAYTDMQNKIDAMTAAGQDAGEWKNTVGEALTAVNTAGPRALDLALQDSARSLDSSTAGALARVLAPLAQGPTPGLMMALHSTDGAIRSEAAVALGNIAARTHSAPGADVVAALGDAAGREVMRVAFVIAGDAAKADAAAAPIEAMNVFVNRSTSGARALGMLRRAPHVDLVIVADSLPDVTTAQVIDELRADDRLKGVPIVVMTADAAAVTANYGERIQGTMTGPEDKTATEAALSKEVTGDRALAEDLAARASTTLARLAAQGSDVSAGNPGLVIGTKRGDKIAIPAMHALAQCGAAGDAPALVAVLADGKRSDDARSAAGHALAALLGRTGGTLEADALASVQGVVASSASMNVREAAAQVLGSLPMSPEARAEILRKLRAQ
jgi:HEAT repeat protein/CheY-like chemotaxis protein